MLHVPPYHFTALPHRSSHSPDDAANTLVISLIAKDQKVPTRLLFHPSRGRRSTAAARHLAMYLLHVVLGRSLTQVGEIFDRDRTTVSYACAAVEDHRDDPVFDAAVDRLQEQIEAELATIAAMDLADEH